MAIHSHSIALLVQGYRIKIAKLRIALLMLFIQPLCNNQVWILPMVIELITFGLLLGWGAAIPIGAVNLEIIRRNLYYGTSSGMALGTGACLADLTYLLFMSYGAMQLLGSPLLIQFIGVSGSLILLWFGWKAFMQKAVDEPKENSHAKNSKPILFHIRDGYLMTLINPYSIIFWSSISFTLAANTRAENATIIAGLGVLFGAISWNLGLNTFLHLTRHHISTAIIKKMNRLGGLILIALSCVGLYRSVVFSFSP